MKNNDLNISAQQSLAQTPNGPAVLDLAGQRYLLVNIGPSVPSGNVGETFPAKPTDAPAPAPKAKDGGSPEAQGERRRYVYGLKGLAELFGCSTSTAFAMKKSGILDDAISQIGHTIVVDADKALAAAKIANKNN